MPEGDSVAIAATRMHRHLAGHVITGSEFRVPQLAGADLAGQRVTEFVSRGKHMLLRTDGGWTLHTHFEMDGSWSVLRAGSQLPRRLVPDVRVALHLDDGRTAVGLSLPVVELVRTDEENRVVGHLGPDLLGADWDEDEAVARLLGDAERPVVQALLDQRNLAGVGNLWAVESCFLRGAYPWRPVGDLGAEALRAHVRLLRRMLRHSVEFRTGQATTGVRGGRENYEASHYVYGRYRKLCRRCGTPVEMVHATVGMPYARETWWCPRCQPATAASYPPPVAPAQPRVPAGHAQPARARG